MCSIWAPLRLWLTVCRLQTGWALRPALPAAGTGHSQAWVLTSQARESERLICPKIKRPYPPATFTTTALTNWTEPRGEKSAPLLTAAQRSLDDMTPPHPPKYFYIESERITQTINLDSKRRFSPKSYTFACLSNKYQGSSTGGSGPLGVLRVTAWCDTKCT